MIKEYRMLSFVQRWGITPRLHPQSVAEHCYFVTLYCSVLCDMFKIVSHDRLRVMEYALRHDLQEIYTGDIPGPAKRALRMDPDLGNSFMADRLGHAYREVHREAKTKHLYVPGGDSHLTPHDVVKVADLIDELFYLEIESLMGNRMVEKLPRESNRRLARALEPFRRLNPDVTRDLLEHLTQQLDRLRQEGAHLPPMDTDLPLGPRDDGSPEPDDRALRRKKLIQTAIDLGFTGKAIQMMEDELPKPEGVSAERQARFEATVDRMTNPVARVDAEPPVNVAPQARPEATVTELGTLPLSPRAEEIALAQKPNVAPQNLPEADRAAYISPNRDDDPRRWNPTFVWFRAQGMDAKIQPQKWSDGKYMGEESWKKSHILAQHPITDWEFDFLTLDECAAKWPLVGYVR